MCKIISLNEYKERKNVAEKSLDEAQATISVGRGDDAWFAKNLKAHEKLWAKKEAERQAENERKRRKRYTQREV